MTDPVEKAVDVVADAAAEVAHQAEGVEQVIRSLNQVKLSYAALGVAIGGAVGSFIAFNLAYRRAEMKYNDIAAQEIADMREHYHEKVVALDSTQKKTDLEALVQDRGYSSPEPSQPPMAVTPPTAVVEAAREFAEEDEVEADDPDDEIVKSPTPESDVRNVFRDAEVNDTWDYHEERRRRSPLKPYVIHRDERDDTDAYDEVTFTYYEEDDVLCNERDEVVGKDERDKMIGEAHLGKFGHGSGDASIVYVRNDQLEMDFELVRSPNSYAEEVHGFEPPEIRHSHRRRSFDDE